MGQLPSYKIFPLGDAALIIDFGNIIDESINKLVLPPGRIRFLAVHALPRRCNPVLPAPVFPDSLELPEGT